MKTNDPNSLLLNLGMLCVAVVALFFSYRSSEYARISAETAKESVVFQSAQLRPQLVYSFSRIETDKNFFRFTMSVKNDGPLPAVIGSLDLPIYSDGNTIWSLHFLQNGVIPKGQSQDVPVSAARMLKIGDRTVDMLNELKAAGSVSIEVRYTAEGLPGQTYYDAKKYFVQFH